MRPDVSRAEIDAELTRALPSAGDLLRIEPLLKGHGHQSFVLETSVGTSLLLKIALRDDERGKLKSLCRALELAARHHIPAPKLLHFCEGSASFAGRPWLIQEFLPGEDGEVAIGGMSGAERATFFRDFGQAVARLHSIDLGYFAENLASAPRATTWVSVVEARMDRLESAHRDAGLLSRPQIAILAMVGAGAPAIRAAVVHRDLYLANTLATAQRFRCLLDFEHARSCGRHDRLREAQDVGV
jgi:aminoglycoside phosphotransferase (APT) family kinase protein